MNQILALSFAVIIVILIAVLFRISIKKTAAEKKASELGSTLSRLKIENTRLSKWQVVDDADGRAKEILITAQAELENAKTQAASMISESAQRAKNLEVEALRGLDSAIVQAKGIVAEAEKKAEEIAGSAYEAMKNVGQLGKTAKAMKNIIEGYGDEYLVPRRSLLDDLAEDFGFTEAGTNLKAARERTKSMVRNSTAATCEYVEAKRKDTAMDFVVDAFNGKVDSILSRIKNDNAGKLEQEIKDAFTLVNHNGKAFREAAISPEYLASRIDELKWAAVAQQLKLEEKEEQRRIKEQIKEEEKARRDFERAMKDATKEEDILRKAMEKAQAQIAQASEEQKVKYEAQLTELSERLRAAEEKSQRALSMAQQTKRGHVYIISNIGSFGEHVYKIGLTRRLDPLDRIKELGDSSVPFEFDVHALIFSEDAPALENQLHKHFVMMQMNKVNYRKEFFKVDIGHIREEVEKFGLVAKWTMAALAEEYRQSMLIEKAIAEDPAKKDAWINRQLLLEPADSFVDSDIADKEEIAPCNGLELPAADLTITASGAAMGVKS
jgi:hypothetical protein